MPLNLQNFETRGNVSTLNQWADQIEQSIRQFKGNIGQANFQINSLQTQINNLPPPVTTSGNALQLTDNFCFGTGAQVGELHWGLTGTGSVSLTATETGAFPFLGTFNLPNNTSASDFLSVVYPPQLQGGICTDALWPLFDYPSWTYTTRFSIKRYPDSYSSSPFPLAQTSLYIGFMGPSGTSNTVMRRPALGAWLRFDTDTTAPSIGDTTFWFETVANDVSAGSVSNTQGNTFNTLIVPTEFTWYTLTLSCTAAGSVQFNLVGTDGSSASTTLSVPIYQTDSGGFGSVTLHGTVVDVSYGGILHPFGIGSKVTFSGQSNIGGTYPLIFAGTNKSDTYVIDPAVIPGSGIAVVGSGYPAAIPFYNFGNDTQATPTQDQQLAIDFFSFVWNPPT